jgi:hypothetical protein
MKEAREKEAVCGRPRSVLSANEPLNTLELVERDHGLMLTLKDLSVHRRQYVHRVITINVGQEEAMDALRGRAEFEVHEIGPSVDDEGMVVRVGRAINETPFGEIRA